MWRASRLLPERGLIGIFNRSYYEEVPVVRVHPALLARGLAVSDDGSSEHVWSDRYEDINAFERHLRRNGTRIVMILLHDSGDEQKRRLLERLDDPDMNWKFSVQNLAERKHRQAYTTAYEEVLSATSSP